jgi:hypothetical protein
MPTPVRTRPCSACGLRTADPSQIARKRAQGGVSTGSFGWHALFV